MFRRKPGNLPADPTYPSDLAKLGFKVNEKNQFVSTNSRVPAEQPWDPTDLTHAADQLPGTLFTPHATDSDRANHVRCKAMDAAAKAEVHKQLREEFGVKPLYVFDRDGCIDVKPEGPHVEILCTKVGRLGEKKEVVVVVGEHNQELAIWSWRLLLGREGIDGGGGVGLGKLLRKSWKGGEGWDEVKGGLVEEGVKKLTLGGDLDEMPGLVFLNPGELLYSPTFNKNFSLPAWHARQKESALHDHIAIDEKYNYVPGHSSPAEHAHSVLHNVIPAITHPEVQLYIVGIGDGCEAVMSYFDRYMRDDVVDKTSDDLTKLALIQTTHNVAEIDSEKFKGWLGSEERARSYVCSEQPKGSLLTLPERATPLNTEIAQTTQREPLRIYPTQIGGLDADEVASQVPSSLMLERDSEEGTPSIMTETEAEGSMISPAEEMAAPALVDGEEKPANLKAPEDKASGSPVSRAEIKSSEQIAADLPPLPETPGVDLVAAQDDPTTNASSPKMTIVTVLPEQEAGPVETPPPATGGWDLTPRKPGLWDDDLPASANAKPITTFSPEVIADAKRTDGETPYDYTQDPVSCATFSAGIEDVSEMVWPVVMRDVVTWFWGGDGGVIG